MKKLLLLALVAGCALAHPTTEPETGNRWVDKTHAKLLLGIDSIPQLMGWKGMQVYRFVDKITPSDSVFCYVVLPNNPFENTAISCVKGDLKWAGLP